MSEAATPEQKSPVFNIEKLYVKDLSLEMPHAPVIFLDRESPQIELQLNTEFTAVEEGIHEVVLTVTVTARQTSKDRVMFLIEAKQAGIFRVRNIPLEDVERLLSTVCPDLMFPYVREVISDVSVRAGFAPVILNPVSFEALYQQKKAQAGNPTQH